MSAPAQQNSSTATEGVLSVQFPRSRLHGYFGLPYSGEVQVLESGSALPPADGYSGEYVSVDAGGGDMDFAIAPGVVDEEPPQKGESEKATS